MNNAESLKSFFLFGGRKMSKKKCPECGGTKLIRDYEKGELICGSCGLIIADNIQDAGPEWRAFDAEQKEKRARGGAPIKYMLSLIHI